MSRLQLISKRMLKRTPVGQVWTKSCSPSEPALTVTLPRTLAYLWLRGRQRFGDPLAVRRWSVAVLNPREWGMYFGVPSHDSKAAAERQDDLTGALALECPGGQLCDGSNTLQLQSGGGLSRAYVLTFEVDLERNTMAVQTVDAPDELPPNDFIAGAIALARSGLVGL